MHLSSVLEYIFILDDGVNYPIMIIMIIMIIIMIIIYVYQLTGLVVGWVLEPNLTCCLWQDTC